MNKQRLLFGVSLVSIMSFSIAVSLASNKNKDLITSAYSTSSLPTTIDLNAPSESTIRSYYSSLNNKSQSERQGNNLLKNLKTILKNGQKYYSYDSGDTVWKMYEITDRDWDKSPASAISGYNSSTNKITNYSYNSSDPYVHALYVNRNVTNQTKAWADHEQDQWGINREHVWPKAEGFHTSGAGGARGDPFHLMAGNGYANNIHSNYYYGYVDTSKSYTNCGSKYSNLSGNYRGSSKTLGGSTNVFEPQDSDKGDIARAIFYMVARYNYLSGSDSDGINTNNPNLALTQSLSDWESSGYVSSTSKTGKLGIMTDLLAWHHADPVDEYEIRRNNLLYTNFTNNRNPFIDFPEWADFIWGSVNYNGSAYVSNNTTPTGYATPSSDTINGYNAASSVSVTGVSLNVNSTTLSVGSSIDLIPTISPSNASNKSVTWTSSRTSVATVTNGTVNAVATGNATITVRTADGGFTATCSVTVQTGSIAVTGVNVNPTSLSLEVGDSSSLAATVLPINATNKNVTWTSSNTSAATVSNGLVTAVSEGSATITATTADGGFTATCAVTVAEAEVPTVDFTISKDDYTPGYAASGTSGTILKTIVSNNDLTINYAGINTQSQNGTAYPYTMYAGGNGYIYSSNCPSGYYPSKVTVSFTSGTGTGGKVGITYSANAVTTKQTVSGAVTKGGICELLNSDETKLYWNFSTNTSNVQVAGISVTYSEIGSAATVSVSGVTLNKNTLALAIGDTESLVATVSPSDATNKDIEWQSSNYSIADVDSEGLVTAVATGTATISVTTDDGGFSAVCEVTVSNPSSDNYVLYTSSLTEGDYIIYYDGAAMKSTISTNRFTYTEVTPVNDQIASPASDIVWHIAQSGSYWTIYSASTNKYAAGTGTKNHGALIDDGTANMAKWTVTLDSGKYDFENYGRSIASTDSGNKWLRRNGTYGFACYASGTGGALTLYKKSSSSVVPVTNVSLNKASTSLTVGGSETLTATVLPNDATIKDVTWSASNNVVSVSDAGVIKACKVGTSVVTVSTVNRGLTATCTVTVTSTNTTYSLTSGSPFINNAPYKMYFNNGTENLYFVGEMSGYYGKTSNSVSSGIDVYFEQNGNGQNIYFCVKAVKYYIYVAQGDYTNFKCDATSASGLTAWTYDSNNHTLKYGSIYIGSTGTFSTIGAYSSLPDHPIEFITPSGEGTLPFASVMNRYISCNAQGTSAPTFSGFAWSDFSNAYSNLHSDDQSALTGASANQGGTAVQQCVARYDYIVGKYQYNDFLSRSPSPIGNHKINLFSKDTDNASTTAIIILVSAITLITAGGFILLHRKKEK